jgi:DNA gyrase subunit A
MARTDVVGLPDGERIEDVDVSEEMQGSFLEYAYSVIYSRALPDARDGLKPVQRRILYQMAEMGLRPDRGHVKSARVTGEVMGKLHPHGDGAIYDALVRLAQPFTMRVPLVDGHGNFGSLDDGPAAARYTEARLAEPSMAMTEGLGEDVVDFVPNYDNQIMQPSVLPAAFPNLLVNGASGIAVGMATNMAPHNLGEVVEAAKHLLMHPQATLDELMEFVPGPDLPSGGTIVGLSGVRDAYATGRGTFRTRAKVSVENLTPRKSGLVVTELPYLVGPERVIEKIKDGVQAKKLVGISDVNDLTDRNHGLRLVIGIKSGFNPTAVLEQLYKHTPLGRTSGSTTSRWSRGHRAPSACASCSTSTCGTVCPWSPGAPSTGSPGVANGSTWSRACSSRSSTSTRSSRSSARRTTPRRHARACGTSSTCPRCRPSTSSNCDCAG